MSDRKLAVNGQFYPEAKEELLKYIEHFNLILDDNNIKPKPLSHNKAIIVPHAGYIYSGFTANLAYRQIPNSVENIIVIGPSHKFSFKGASIALYGNYPTPLGPLTINNELSVDIENKFDFIGFNDKVHCEHSTETQFPFIKYYQGDKQVIELVYSDIEYKSLSKVIEYFLKDPKNFIVISTDLSHFYNLQDANVLDSNCIEGIKNKSIKTLEQKCEACGMLGIKALIDVIQNENYKVDILDYRTSADASGDDKRVVGYLSALISSF